METGKPDEVGEVGKNAVGPLNLSRPKGGSSGCLGIVGIGILCGTFAILLETAKQAWAPKISAFDGRSASQAQSGTELLAWTLGLLIFLGVSKVLSHKKSSAPGLNLILENRGIRNNIPGQQFVIWSGISRRGRLLNVGAVFLAGIGALIFALFQKFWLEKLIFSGVAVLISGYGFSKAKYIAKPLLNVSVEGVQVGDLKINWSQIQLVEIAHIVNGGGAYVGTRWKFSAMQGELLAQVTIPESRCLQFREEQILEFVARLLGNEVSPVAQPDINWL